MNKSAEKGLVPELRFPEFKNDAKWKQKNLGKLSTIVRGGSPRPIDNFMTLDKLGLNWLKIGDVDKSAKYISMTKERVTIDALSKTREVHPGDLIMSNSMSFGRPYIMQIKACIHDGWIAVTEIKDYIDLNYLYYFILSEKPQFYFLNAAAGGGIKNLNAEIIKSLSVVYPVSKNEQQKIGDCLSSLDELVNAHTQKLTALKAHKKGLMQQLFPAESETVPKLRFPEFRGDGDWCFDDLGSKAKKVGSGITPRGGDKNYKSAGVPFVRSQNIGWGSLLLDNIAYIEEEVHQSFSGTEIKESDVLLNITGASIGRTAIADQRVTGGNVNQHVCIIRTKLKELHPVYLSQFILSPNGQLQIDSFQAGGNREGLNFAQIRSFSIPIPPNVEEQKKIADGLSSIDELITAQSQKIDALKTHKQGLMQQLFPVVNEVSV